MEINYNFLVKAFENAVIEQTANDHAKQGYTVKRKEKLGKFTADLVAKKGKKTIVFEFKSGRWNKKRANEVTRFRNYVVHEIGGEFKLILVNTPQKKEIIIDDIENILYQYMFEDMSQVDQLATHVYLSEVADVDIDVIEINTELIHVLGSGSVIYELQYGSDADMRNDDGVKSIESFPFTFNVYLKHDLSVDEVEELDIDTSSFYE